MNIKYDTNYTASKALVAAKYGEQAVNVWQFSFYFGFYQDSAVPR